MRVLVTWGSERGGTAGIGEMLAGDLRREGMDVAAAPANEVEAIDADAVIVGGALYANRWHPEARRFIERHIFELRQVPVWLFSSGPLDDSARDTEIPPTYEVSALMDRVGALGHATFGGALSPEATGFAAAAMAKEHSGDWRDPEDIRAWAHALATEMPAARPRPAVEPPGRPLHRVLFFTAPSAGRWRPPRCSRFPRPFTWSWCR